MASSTDLPSVARPVSRCARIVGFFFLAAFFAYGGGQAIMESILASPSSLSSSSLGFVDAIATQRTLLGAGALLVLLNSAILIGIGVGTKVLLQPYRSCKWIGHAYLAGRVVEAVLLVMGMVSLMSLTALVTEIDATGGGAAAAAGRGALAGAAAGASSQAAEGAAESAANAALRLADWAGPQVVAVARQLALRTHFFCFQTAMAALGAGSLLLCHTLWAADLVPAALSLWGFVGYAVFLLGSLLEVLGVQGNVGLLLCIPGGLFEAAFGGYLLFTGRFGPRGLQAPAKAHLE